MMRQHRTFSRSMGRATDVFTSWGASAARLGAGVFLHATGKRPEKLLELYDFEACPFCRKAREAFTAFDLDVMVYPCPKGGERFRPGKKMFPYLVDPNTGTSMYESMDIARYLAKEYAKGSLPLGLSLGPLSTVSSMMASAWRAGRGGRARASKAPDKPLELWSFEGSPYCRLAREALCELEIPYLLHNVAKGSPGRKSFTERSGKMMVPYLVDDNTGKAMFESADIVAYLNATYAA
jgi:glutathione S-transferase